MRPLILTQSLNLSLSLSGSEEFVDLRPVLMALRHNSYFTGVSLIGLPRREVISVLGDVLRYNTALEVVEMPEIDAKDGLVEFGEALVFNAAAKLFELDFSRNPLRSHVFGLTNAFCQISMPLRKLHLRDCSIPAKSMNQLVHALAENPAFCVSITDLDLGGNDLSMALSSNALSALLGNISQVPLLEALGFANSNIMYGSRSLSLSLSLALSH